MRLAVVQHRKRTHPRMDLAALLTAAERAADEGASAVVFPDVPGIAGNQMLMDAFLRNVAERVPGLTWITSLSTTPGGWAPTPTALGSTAILSGDDCIDPEVHARVAGLGCAAVIMLFGAEDELQGEAMIELALDASGSLAPLVVIAETVGGDPCVGAGTGAVVHRGEILAEAVAGEDLIVADLPAPGALPALSKRLPVPAPVLAQRLAAHRSRGGHAG